MAVTQKQVLKLTEELSLFRDKLEEMKEAKADVLDNAENAEYPNEERCSLLEEQLDILETAIDDLDHAISNLEGYE